MFVTVGVFVLVGVVVGNGVDGIVMFFTCWYPYITYPFKVSPEAYCDVPDQLLYACVKLV